MGSGYRLSKKAQANLTKIWGDVGQNNPTAADHLYFRIFDKIEAAAVHPGIGSPRPDLGEKARMLVEGNYKIIYVPAKSGILVTAIAHTRRDPANWL